MAGEISKNNLVRMKIIEVTPSRGHDPLSIVNYYCDLCRVIKKHAVETHTISLYFILLRAFLM